MDKVDQKILALLDNDPRRSTSRIAAKARVSQQVADYRIKRLVDAGVITMFGTVINVRALGREIYRVFFTFDQHKKQDLQQVYSYLSTAIGVYWAARTGGKYDLVIALLVRTFEEFDTWIDAFNKAFPGLVSDYKAGYVIDHYLYRHKQLGSNDHVLNASPMEYGYADSIVSVDNLDVLILNKMKDNCRISALQIATEAHVSYKTIINRIRKLMEQHVIIGYRLCVGKLEQRPSVILVSFKKYSRATEKSIISFLGMNSAVTQVLRMFGVWNLLIHARFTAQEELQEFIIALRSTYDMIDNYEIIPLFQDIKIDFFPEEKER